MTIDKTPPVKNLKMLIESEITPFVSLNGVPSVYINNKPLSSFPIDSQIFIAFIYKTYADFQKIALGEGKEVKDLKSSHIKDFIDYTTGVAYSNEVPIGTWNRVGHNKETDSYYYNIGDGVNVIKISESTIEQTSESDVTFNYFDKFNSIQCFPNLDSDTKNVDLLYKYINIKDNNTKILLLSYIISLFNPLINKYILYFHGLKGASKTTSFRIIRSLIDPSPISSHISQDSNLVSIPETTDNLVMLSKYHYCLYFDNVNYLHPKIQSTLARMALGQRDSKRALYSNDDQVVYDYKPCLGINGVNQIMTQDELIQRSLLIEIDPIVNRKTEHEIWKEFKKDKPLILGAMLKVFQRSIKVIKNEDIDHTKLPRMADIAKWMTAIAIVLGVKKEDFYKILAKNTMDQDIESIEFSPVARMVIAFMQNKYSWDGKATDLHREIKQMIDSDYLEHKQSKYNISVGSKPDQFPSTPISFAMSLKKIIENLANVGYVITKETHKDAKYYVIVNKLRQSVDESYIKDYDNELPI